MIDLLTAPITFTEVVVYALIFLCLLNATGAE